MSGHKRMGKITRKLGIIADVKPPVKHSFAGIYLMGDFGISATSLITQALWKLA